MRLDATDMNFISRVDVLQIPSISCKRCNGAPNTPPNVIKRFRSDLAIDLVSRRGISLKRIN